MKRGLVLSVSLALALTAAPAEAKKKHRNKAGLGPVVTATATGAAVSSPGALSTASVSCPGRRQAVGGGFSAPFGTVGDVEVLSSYRSDPRTWTVDGTPIIGMGPASITGFAYCRRANHKLIDVAGTGQVPTFFPASGSAVASCPPGARLIGGGFQSTLGPGPSDRPILTASLSTAPGRWSVTGISNTIAPETLTAHAYCMRGIRAPQILSATVSEATPQFSSETALAAGCSAPRKPKTKKGRQKPQRLLAAGGFFTPPPTVGTVAVPVYTDSRLSGGGWLAAAVNIGGDPGTFSVTSQGLCF